MWHMFALLSGFGAAVLAVLIKLYFRAFNPFAISLIFSVITSIMLIFVELFIKKTNIFAVFSLSWHQWILLIIAGCINCLAFLSYLLALQLGKPSAVVALDRLGILFVVFLSIFLLQEAFSLKSIVGAILMTVGASLLL